LLVRYQNNIVLDNASTVKTPNHVELIKIVFTDVSIHPATVLRSD